MAKPLEIVRIPVGPLEVNAWVVANPETLAALVVDPGAEPEAILGEIQRRGWRLETLVVTHGHADHICAAAALRRATGATVVAPEGDAPMLADAVLCGAQWIGYPFEPVPVDAMLPRHPAPWNAIGRVWTVLEGPGHTPGHIALYAPDDDALFCGDILFAGSIGRTDLPGGSYETMARTLRDVILRLPDSTRVFPGHGPDTTLERERRTNLYLRQVLATPPGKRGDP